MASKLLYNGDLNLYQPISEDAVFVYQKALAFRGAISNSLSQNTDPKEDKLEDYLAIPRFSQDNQHADWFIPFESRREDGEYEIVPWKQASKDEKEKALEKLRKFRTKLYDYGDLLEARALNSNDRLFAHFLVGNKAIGQQNNVTNDSLQDNQSLGDNDRGYTLPAIHYPSEDCLFIVDGKPVITFWGFLKRGERLYSDPFYRLEEEVYPNKTVVTDKVVGAAPLGATATAVTRSHKWCWLLLPLLLLLLPLLLYLLWWWLFGRGLPLFKAWPDLGNFSLDPKFNADLNLPDADLPKVNLPDVDVDLPKVKVPDVDLGVDGAVETPNIPDDATTEEESPVAEEPVAEETQEQPSDDEAEQPQEQPQEDSQEEPQEEPQEQPQEEEKEDPNAVEPPTLSDDEEEAKKDPNATLPPQLSEDKDGPSLSNKDLQSGDISKLNGVWKVNSAIFDTKTNKPLQLQYEFKDGKGQATITQSDGVKCTGAVKGGLSKGALNINSQSEAKCTDGSVYEMPKVVCTQGDDGNSDCVSTYQNSKTKKTTQFPMNLHR